ncbi:hypothetical protein [Deinococcus budaensis]|uniref:Uncharacterized protein n=1 Tax=Deinococcus budaensis TaxID=1665626 RepID=A0A7W8GIK2_9DEIO|nr:hypothetical protein [Deinococcus budaensis]MBB5235994.1 hypothetical protein [Deinococcus budaensis]
MSDHHQLVLTPEPRSAKARRPVYAHAILHVRATLEVTPEGVEAVVSGVRLPLALADRAARQLAEAPPVPGQMQQLSLWPRTTEDGVLEERPVLFQIMPAKAADAKPQLDVAGVVEAVLKDEGLLRVRIDPNARTNLTQPFSLHLWTPLEGLERQYVGRTVQVFGEWRSGSGRLVVSSTRRTDLASARQTEEQQAS